MGGEQPTAPCQYYNHQQQAARDRAWGPFSCTRGVLRSSWSPDLHTWLPTGSQPENGQETRKTGAEGGACMLPPPSGHPKHKASQPSTRCKLSIQARFRPPQSTAATRCFLPTVSVRKDTEQEANHRLAEQADWRKKPGLTAESSYHGATARHRQAAAAATEAGPPWITDL
ncbi:hypothetical protein ACOMHN_048343 [Nucella lapillus]